ncbi:hypothetical protein BX616_010414 [Lobosporangium transversale]|uniref:Uncharacterized protein n=1 Tax=Lobosporangium transversale TaxID=64571 RepID=A0A1Y2GAD2_9FUNG|nr:hypothetical protein BCR41DRAFT_400515 [Lobosporangium transversale]KAF9912120.1 hypothetical protein BX616_010414 [Lobosporangium transversale]ORZ05503.1 hypothetical protein BCR41DRAFT_400515 [Lobosporangium transversale]|eukprot:XP_021877077.1 hypothetical protein BCR41DRAFT_400515 [Lobosporangium transversale]
MNPALTFASIAPLASPADMNWANVMAMAEERYENWVATATDPAAGSAFESAIVTGTANTNSASLVKHPQVTATPLATPIIAPNTPNAATSNPARKPTPSVTSAKTSSAAPSNMQNMQRKLSTVALILAIVPFITSTL